MSLSAPDYQAIYRLQDEVFAALQSELQEFYLTGGTALGRFYLDHRYSDDLDFFINADPHFADKVNVIYRKLRSSFVIDEMRTLQTDTYTRFYIRSPHLVKIDIVNDIPERWGGLNQYKGINIDTPANILSNKLGAILSRDEPKDVFDIVAIAESYSFKWIDVYQQTLRQQIVNESDISMRISGFPVAWLDNQPWLKGEVVHTDFVAKLNIIADDFIFARENSLGSDKTNLEGTEIILHDHNT